MKAVLLTSSILILLMAALRPVLRGRLDPRAQYALWLIVALRLLVPGEWASSSFSAMALLSRAEEPRQAAQAVGQTAVPVPAMSYEAAFDQALQEYQQARPVTASFTDLDEVNRRAQEIQAKPITLADLAAKYAKPVWLGGAAAMGLWFLLVNLRLRRKLRAALPVDADCPLPVRVTPDLPSPCLCGEFRPVIYVTPSALTDPDRMRHVLAHELTHHCHRDHWWALVRCLCLCVYWFDPLVWWAAAMSRQDCELACDAGAIRRLGEEERLAYGRTLVAMIAAGRNSLLQTATTMTGGKRRVKERVTLIARKPKTVIALALAAAVVLGLAVGCTFTGAPEPEDDSNPMSASRSGLPLDTLAERLADIPEELRPQVVNRADLYNDTGVLADYWWDVPAEWVDESAPWMMTVYQWDQARFEGWYFNIGHGNGGTGAFFEYEVFARDREHYYVLCRPTAPRFEMEGSEDYTAAYNAIWDFAMETVLETEDVESYDPDLTTPSPTVETLVERLLDVPVGWRDDVEAVQSGYSDAVYGDGLVEFWMKRDWINMDGSGLGFLMRVDQLTQEQFDQHIGRDNSGWECYARRGDAYYAVVCATDVRYYSPDDAEDYHNAYDTIYKHVRQTLVETEGMEPYSLTSAGQPCSNLQKRLLAVPDFLRGEVESSPAMGGEVDCLATFWMTGPQWADLRGGYLLDLYRMNEAQIRERLGRVWEDADIFARSGDEFYVIVWPNYGRYTEDEELDAAYWNILYGIWNHVKETVLNTEGVERFDVFTEPPYFYKQELILDSGPYAIEGMDYTLVTSYRDVPNDLSQWYLVGRLSQEPVWMFTRNRGAETMFQIDDHLTQSFPYRACFYGGGHTADGRAPQIKRLEGGGSENGTYGTFAVITHLFQGGTDQLYQLTVYDLDANPVASYVHDWKPLMDDFNKNRTLEFDKDSLTATVFYMGQTAVTDFNDEDRHTEAERDAVREYGVDAIIYEYGMDYAFADDGAITLRMPVTSSYMACWTVRFTGNGFQTGDFRFVEGSLWR